MKKSLFLAGLFCIPLIANAQRYRTVELKPITQQGWKYYYDLVKVASPASLEIPLRSVQDEEVDLYVKSSKA